MKHAAFLVAFAAVLASDAPADASTLTFTGTRANVNPLSPPGTGRCAPVYFNTVTIAPGATSSTGSSNLGNFASTQSHCIVTAPPTQVVDGIFSYDFEAGDRFFGTYTGQVSATGTPGVFTGLENLIVTGGTGRFFGATGTVTSTGTLRFVQGAGVFEGTVNGVLNTAAIPEPATWLTMILGFGATGAAMRHRRRKPVLAFG